MKAASVKELKTELSERSPKELMEICLRLSKFKKENKELLTYILFESDNEDKYIHNIQKEIDAQFELVNKKNSYLIKKSIMKIQRMIKKYIRYSKKKATEVEVLIYFCQKLKAFRPSVRSNRVLSNLYNRNIEFIKRKISALHEDLQYDYMEELEELL